MAPKREHTIYNIGAFESIKFSKLLPMVISLKDIDKHFYILKVASFTDKQLTSFITDS